LSLYVDTSILTAYYCPETGSEKAQAFLSAASDPAVSWLTEVELASALARKVREHQLTVPEARRIIGLWRDHLRQDHYQVLPLLQSHYRVAGEILANYGTGLRTLDALHVTALQESLTLATADRRLATAAETCGLQVVFLDFA
jgi:predicted nucleic acid-binding protein